MLFPCLAAALLTAPALAPNGGHDLAKLYPPELDVSPGLIGHATTAGLDDLHRVEEFRYRLGSKFDVRCEAATLVVGHKHKSALWAVLLPDEPGRLEHPDLDGDAEFESLFLRLHPETIGDLFPAKTLEGPSDDVPALLQARAIFAHKINSAMQVNNRAHLAGPELFVFDAETSAGPRAFFLVDEQGKSAKFEPSFAERPLPRSAGVDAAAAGHAFDTVADAFSAEYAKFELVPDLDWIAHVELWRAHAQAARDDRQLAAAIGCLLEPLRDGHVSVSIPGGYVPVHSTDWWNNASYSGVKAMLGELRQPADRVQYTRTKSGLGYVLVDGLNGASTASAFDEALENLGDTWGLILDLRFNGGGDELLGGELAGRFLEESAVYSTSRYRSGPEPTDLGPWNERIVEPRGPWRYASPVLVLQGPNTWSSAESMVWMLRQSDTVETFGAPTHGASGNPRVIELPQHGISVRLPRWLDAGPDREIFEHIGIEPNAPFEAPLEDYSDTEDPCLAAALGHLDESVRKADRRPGRGD